MTAHRHPADPATGRLQHFIAAAAGADEAVVTTFRPLAGGAIQENWLLDVDIRGGACAGPLAAVLRADAPSGVLVSHRRAQEFALLRAAAAAGVTVPEPLWLSTDPGVLGRDFFVMRRVPGTAAGHRLVKDGGPGGDRAALLRRLGGELARLHAIVPPRPDLDFLPRPEPGPALHWVGAFRAYLDGQATPRPALEWGLRWLEVNAPPAGDLVLCHHDFRTGNYMVDDGGLTGILDWEFAGWSDPMEDIGWFCAKCWRFGAHDREAGGLGPREPFYDAYEEATGRAVAAAAVAYWEVMAHVRWAVIALQQAERHVSGGEESLELALTAHVVPELEYEILAMTGAG